MSDPAAVPNRVPAEDISLPALLRAARSVFGAAIRAELEAHGCDDLPPNGPFVLGAIARTGAPLAQVIRHLGVSKQTAGQLVDTLVARGYLERTPDPDDRRRLVVTLTERGLETAAVVRAAVEEVESDLVRRVGAERLAHTRQTLLALIESGDGTDH
jgi:DNA-binding MarR family transcriptional regulator